MWHNISKLITMSTQALVCILLLVSQLVLYWFQWWSKLLDFSLISHWKKKPIKNYIFMRCNISLPAVWKFKKISLNWCTYACNTKVNLKQQFTCNFSPWGAKSILYIWFCVCKCHHFKIHNLTYAEPI